MLAGLVLVLLVATLVVLGQECNLDDSQRTRGNCQKIRNCTFAINNLYADVSPKICTGRIVCCPTQQTISEQKCLEWRSYLQTPPSFSPTPLPEPICTLPPKSFITGGRDAEKYEFTHAVALGYGTNISGLHYSCGGTLISDQYILTAAHCARTNRGKPTYALLGDITLIEERSVTRQILPISEVITHPNYKPPLNYHDIALVKLKNKIELDRFLLPACLPSAKDSQVAELEAIGWGTVGPGEPQSNILQAVNLTYFKHKDCEPFYADTADKSLRFPDGLKRTQLCAGDLAGKGRDTCNGDSGGSLTQNELYNGEELRCLFRIVGITSFGSKLCGYGTPGVYTKVLSYVPWIERIVFGVS